MEAEKLKMYGIFVLREYARSIGVKSPTIFNKHDLIEEILHIFNGDKLPVLNSKRGRPVNRLTFDTAIQQQAKEAITPAAVMAQKNEGYKKQIKLLRQYLRKCTDILIDILSHS